MILKEVSTEGISNEPIFFKGKFKQISELLEKTIDEFWNIPRSTANFLNFLIKAANSKNVIEIGTSNGYSTIWLAQAVKETGGHLTTIEYWEKRQCIARENLKQCELDDVVTTILGSACEELEKLNEGFDFAFIDANKSEYIKYFEILDRNFKRGGIIAADNVLSHPEKTQSFIEAIIKSENYQTEILPLPKGLLIARKIK